MTSTLNLVLLVDDDTVTNLMHQRHIMRRGLAKHVDAVTDGQYALDYLQEKLDTGAPPPELILLDINMPRMSGFEFLDAYSAFPESFRAGQRIVMVSTSLLRRDQARAEASDQISDFASKPISAEAMEQLVRG